MSEGIDSLRWRELVAAHNGHQAATMRAIASMQDVVAVLRRALRTVADRHAALTILLHAPSELRQELFSDLVEAASVGHSDIELCRIVVKSIPLQWARTHIESSVQTIIDLDPDDDEHYRRLCELLAEIDPPLARNLAKRALTSASDDVREVGCDFIEF